MAPEIAVAVRVPEGATPQAVPEELELLLEDELEVLLDEEELELEDELEELLLDEVLVLLLELLLDEELELEDEPLIVPAEAVRVMRSRRAPSSRLTMRSVCVPAARLLKVAGAMVA